MDGGIAVQFAARWPDMEKEYKKCAGRKNSNSGDLRLAAQLGHYLQLSNPKPTRENTQYDAVTSAIEVMLRHAQDHGIREIVMPQVDCGVGGLRWEQPETEIAATVHKYPSDVYVYTLR